ncbi:MAG: fatty acid desaturase [Anaerolineae bacterium]|nr:fatty acid desaturase [Anaerolineae bacterium]
MTDLPAAGIDKSTWQQALKPFARADPRRSTWQIINTIVPYIALWVLMYYSLRISYWLTLLLAIPAAGFMIRLFIQFHDAGHMSFFKSPKANRTWGFITGVLTFTPYENWRHSHATHHATAGDLDRRGTGDVMTLTVEEWLALPPGKRFGYRLFRWPPVMFLLGPIYVFLISQRFAGRKASKKDRMSVIYTNLGIAVLAVALGLLMGFKEYLLIQLPIIWLGGMLGVWLFYVQHQFEGIYWERHDNWDFYTAAVEGCSYYKLPKILQWFTGNIGIHHIHHLSPRIPNYNLQACLDANPAFQVEPVTLITSLKSMQYRLYDEANRRLVGFREAKRLYAPA